METRVVFEEKVALAPNEFNRLRDISIDQILLNKFAANNEGRCSIHGWVVPGSLRIISRSMAQIEGGRFTGDLITWIQVEGSVIYPVDGIRVTGLVLKKNKMGIFVIYKDAIQIMVPRDLHIGNEEFDAIQVGDQVEIEIKKSRFQVKDLNIISVGLFIKKISSAPTAEAIMNEIAKRPKISDIPLDIVGNESEDEEEVEKEVQPTEEEVDSLEAEEDAF
jgi:DNA-directed RNA polymerase subunit E'/Rpb7